MINSLVTGYKSPHQQDKCWMCNDNASYWWHCSWCGLTFKSDQQLLNHLGN